MGNIIQVDTDDGKILVESSDKFVVDRLSGESGPSDAGERIDDKKQTWIKR
jgi:hypothetical protein